MTTKIALFFIGGLLLCSPDAKAQSVGIGTETPNSNAILELVAPDNNQGLLIPRMTTAERTASTFVDNLSASDNGLMVYDEDENNFFFWINDQWIELATGNLSGLPDQAEQNGKFLSSDGSSALWTNIDFSELENIPAGLADGDNIDDADANPTNEIQDISTSGAAGNITLSDGSTLNLNVDDADADASNEFQDLTLSGNTLSLTNSSSTVDLSPFSGTNTDNQTLGLSGSDLSISGGNTIDISSINTNLSEAEVDAFTNNNGYLTEEVDGSLTNEIQDISTSGAAGNISLSDGSTLNLNVNDGDADDTNEFQTISKSGNTVTLSDGGGAFSVADNDNNASNEIQDLTLSGSTLSLTSSSVNIDLSPFSGTNTDNQTLSLSGSNLSITGGNTIDISSIDSNLSEAEVDAFVADNGYLTALDVSGYDTDASDDFDGAFSSLSGVPVGLSDGDDVGITSESDPTVPANIKDGIDWSELSSIPTDIADGDDGITSESDPTVPASIKDGIVWTEVGSIPADIADGDDVGITSESDPTVPASIKDGIDWSELSGIPSEISDGDDVNDADASTSNELNTGMSLVGTTIRVTDAGGTEGVNIGGTFATDAELAASDAADGDKSDVNEIQDISTTGAAGNISLSNGSTLNLNVNDGDASSSNEYNTSMSLSGTSIRVTDGGGTRSVNIGGTFATDAELNSRTFDASAFKATTKATSIPTGFSTLTFDTEVYDIDGSYDPSGVYTVPEDGFYNFGGLLIFQNIPTGLVQILILDGDLNVLYSKAFAPNSIQSSIGFSTDLRLNAGDKISVGISNTGESNAIQIVASPDQSNFFFCGKRFN